MSPAGLAYVSAPIRAKVSSDDRILAITTIIIVGALVLGVALPLYALLAKGFQSADGQFIGLANYRTYFSTPALFDSIGNSVVVTLITTLIAVPLAFLFAYGLTRTCIPGKSLFKGIALIPILMPSLLPAISLVYLFGTQGLAKGLLIGESIYGPVGIVLGELFYVFPHALTILLIALSTSDARLYEAAESLGASKTRIFFTVTLPAARYGLISAFFIVFTLVITDFGVPKVIGGKYNVLATDVYKQVIGRHDFEMGAVVSMILLAPAVLAFFADRIAERRQSAALSARAVPYEPRPKRGRDAFFLVFCGLIGLAILSVLAVAAYASWIKLWPYNLTFTNYHYQFDLRDGGGWASYRNSLVMSAWTAVIGTAIVFVGAYLVEKSRAFRTGRALLQFLAMMPMAVPGLVLGLAFVFFFNAPNNPLNGLYHTMAILVINTIVHFYTVAHLTAVTALKQLDAEFESVSASLKVPVYKTFWRVSVPVCMPAALDISMYLFVNAMTTVSAVVFLYAPHTALASVAVLNMDDSGELASAAAMGMMIVYTSAAVRVLHMLLTRGVLARASAWRKR
ncbi:MAG: putative 2-aminoethylphosphonate ABC transporter permease subunit [Rhodospirillales bacterium]|nr:putative 2-aminoethylphosphonate ABC transporter permease subunit [Rhodospirillales bacterium]MSP79579.1 putative 2-aminoethylphosphonate ABC transporter permease subunit [Rhodospirillales bacterium]